MVIPRDFSSGALSIVSYALKVAPPDSASTLVIAAVSEVLPWSTWPIVPMLQCGLLRENFSLAIASLRIQAARRLVLSLVAVPGSGVFCLDFIGDRLRHLVVVIEGHGVLRPPLAHRAKRVDVAKHVGKRHHGIDHLGDTAGFGAADLTAAGVQVADDVADIFFRG